MKYLLVILLLLGVFSCKEDRVPISDTEAIVIGQSQDMKIDRIDFLLKPKLGLEHGYALDLNKDEAWDCEIMIFKTSGYDKEPYIQSYIRPMNPSCFFNGSLIPDTLFFNSMHEEVKDTLERTFIDKYFYYSCSNITNKDSVVSINNSNFVMNSLALNDVLLNDYVFKSDTIVLNKKDYYRRYYPYSNSDTSITINEIYSDNGNLISITDTVYIGFKISDQGAEKLGWIKLRMDPEYNISIIEQAIHMP